jgi:outer membrane protein assembly factor BamB
MTTHPLRKWPARLIASALLAPALHGVDWPQYRGPSHDGISPEVIRTNWSQQAPQVVWRTGLQSGGLLAGFSTFTVSQGRAYTQIRRSVAGANRELCLALDAATGQELWVTEVGSGDYASTGITGADGPRSTPVVDGDRVYVLSAYLSLSCLDAANGGIVWSKDVRFGAGGLSWQNGAAPLIDGELIFVNCNASANCMMALRKTDGGEVWRRYSYKMTYANPIAVTLLGVRQIIFYTASGLVSVAPETGDVLWRYTTTDGCPYSGTATAISPVVAGDIIYCSAAYDGPSVGAGAVRVTKNGSAFTATQIWRKPNDLKNHWSTPVFHNGYLYGVYGHYSTGVLKCIDPATGNEMWSGSENLHSGGVLLVGGRLLLLNEAGELVLIEPNPSAYTELARVKVLGGKSWNAPAISDGQIYARSTTEAVRVDVSVPAPPQPLKLNPSVVSATGPFRLQIGNADGSPLAASRVANISVLAATNLVAETNGWTRFTNPTVLNNGVLQVDDPGSTSRPRQFFRVVEQP